MNLDPGMLNGLFLVVLYPLVAVRVVKRRFVDVQKVWAKVGGKQTVEQFSKYGKRVKYPVTLLTDGKKSSFACPSSPTVDTEKGRRGH